MAEGRHRTRRVPWKFAGRRFPLLGDVMLTNVRVSVADLRLIEIGLGVQGRGRRIESEQTGGHLSGCRSNQAGGNRDQGGGGENDARNAGHDASLSVGASPAGGKYFNTAIPNRR